MEQEVDTRNAATVNILQTGFGNQQNLVWKRSSRPAVLARTPPCWVGPRRRIGRIHLITESV